MQLKVKLTLLDKQKSLATTDIVPIIFNNEINSPIGSCTLFKEDDGRHYGILRLEKDIDLNVYFYYIGLLNNDGVFHFDGLQFFEEELKNHQTTTLKEMVI